MELAERLSKVKSNLRPDVELIAVSKTHPSEIVQKAYDAGQRHFGENKVQELTDKASTLPADIQWHLIGHLQRNKVKYIVDFVHLIHSVDSLKLLTEIDKRARKIDRVVDCLLQIHIAEEDTKFGLDFEECTALLNSAAFAEMQHVRIRGLMGMATLTDDERQISKEFEALHRFFQELKVTFGSSERWQPEVLSMGMSSDYEIAMEKGSNMVRVGSAIFGVRDYN